MKLFGKKKIEDQPAAATPAPVKAEVKPVPPTVKADKPTEKKSDKKPAAKMPGTSVKAYQILLKPLITEKATELGAQNKYVFSVDPSMNKVEVKKAIRQIYNVDPKAVNILNYSGKQVRYGKTTGQTKKWKKAVVTLKPGDTIQVYEGV